MPSADWLIDQVMNLKTDKDLYVNKTPDEIISSASWKAFSLSAASAMAPGPAGWLTIVPELIAVTKVQINMIYAIAAYYDKKSKFNSTTVLLVLANEVGIALRGTVEKAGGRLLIRSMSSKAMHALSHRISAKIGGQITRKVIGRWVPIVLAPVFGAFSKSMTKKIGMEAVKLFSKDIEIVDENEAH